MRRLRQCIITLAFGLLLPSAAFAVEPPAPAPHSESTVRSKIAIADFRGSDVEVSRFLAETLITNLASSSTLKPLDRPTVRRALAAEVLENEPDPTEEEIIRAGRRMHSAYVLTGSYLIQDEKLLLLAHIYNVDDADVAPVHLRSSGDRSDLVTVAGRLSDQIQEALSGGEAAHPAPLEPRPVQRTIFTAPPAPVTIDPMVALRDAGLCPPGAAGGAVLSEAALARLLARLAPGAAVHAAFTLPHNSTPAPRMLALAGLVKLMLTTREINDYRGGLPGNMPVDFSRLPLWGQPFLAAAVDHGWWEVARSFRPGADTTWAFVAYLTARMGFVSTHREIAQPPFATDVEDENYSGLVIDGRDFPVERSQAPSILDEDGNLLYPFERHAPDADYVNANGMVDYNFDVADQTRAGRHPLIVRAVRFSGSFHDDLVVSSADAERIRRAQNRNKFLFDYRVVFITPN